ncbi:hypothetical protein [Cyanobium sp. CH-040]|uniref:hypothetical protein n=1 Tax=Cyanobium sp. CH-040 TaxID=2823708 RepID=UPI0020CC110F|nr:hypothetical protein [Cyanobium sp. CH-040]MCP9927901.1 hypothetical protein [Cyanobium sp. CH-040]
MNLKKRLSAVHIALSMALQDRCARSSQVHGHSDLSEDHSNAVELYQQPIAIGQAGNDLIANYISSGLPCLITRLGFNELKALRFYLETRIKNRYVPYSSYVKNSLRINAGLFPSTNHVIDLMCQTYVEALPLADAIGVWFNPYESNICNTLGHCASLCELRSLESFHFKRPWTAWLKGKRVLVIHPFEDTIRTQYGRRSKLFRDQDVLPAFDLRTLKAVQSIAGGKPLFPSWMDALDAMCSKILDIDFDIAIIGAGAYGLPLGAFVKRLNKQAIHMGGATQLLFGIRGRRWDSREAYCDLFNDDWVYPAPSETPKASSLVEDSCYWR